MPQSATTLPIVSRPTLDLTTDENHVLINGLLEDGSAIRIPMTVQTAMQVLALLLELQKDKNLQIPETPVDKDKMQ